MYEAVFVRGDLHLLQLYKPFRFDKSNTILLLVIMILNYIEETLL